MDQVVRNVIIPIASKFVGEKLLGGRKGGGETRTVYVDQQKKVKKALAASGSDGRGYASMLNRNFIRRDDDGGSGGRFIS